LKRVTLPLVAFAAAATVTLGVASAGGDGTRAHAAAASTRLLGLTGNAARFKIQTGQDSQVRQAFLGWGQGLSYGSPFAGLLPTLTPIPMLHLGTAGKNGQEAITPGDIASGGGDGYLVALNRSIATWAKAIYVRPMAEMNNSGTLYSGYKANGQSKGAAYAPATYRKAFARIYVILHGGTVDEVNAKLRRLGLPALRGGDVLPNPFPMLRVLWSPLASSAPRVPGNAAEQYYPGAKYVDVEGGDIYDERLTDTAPWSGLDALFKHARARGKPFSVPEWGLIGVDDAVFVRHMCTFAKTHPATEMLAFYESKPGSTFDLETKAASRAEYRKCMTPLAGDFPAWAAGNVPGAGPELLSLALTPNPATGPAPLAVQFAIDAQLNVPIRHWQLFFGDGASSEGDGAPPVTVDHPYAQDGIYQATLVIYPSPPFDPANAQFFVSAAVTVGAGANPPVSFKATPQAPLVVTFQTDLVLPATPSHWRIVFGDGKTLEGDGAPPHFAGHTYPQEGTYHVLLEIDEPPSGRYLAAVDVTVTSAAPPNGTPTGTVLVNGAPFTGGPIPYGSRVDVTNGTLQFTTDTGSLLVYGDGVSAAFVVLRGRDNNRAIVELRLVGGDFGACTRRAMSTSRALPAKATIRQLWGKGKGRFRTRGRYAAATVRGTTWLTADRCDGTFVTVGAGRVQVSDFVKRKTVTVRAGKSYLAKKP
jgi:PKD repeat protein